MIIQKALQTVDALKHNAYTQAEKIGWLSCLEHTVKAEILDAFEEGEGKDFTGYDDTTPLDTVLLVGEPYDRMYLHWLEAQMDYYNGETLRYNNAMLMFRSFFDAYAAHYNRTHRAKGQKWKF